MIEATSAQALWYQVLHDAQDSLDLKLDPLLESYLILTLTAYLRGPLSSHVAEQFLSANQDFQAEERLRDVGDRCLLISGLFPLHAKARMVDRSYYFSIGRTAYATVAERTCLSQVPLYEELSQAFPQLAYTLAAIRPSSEPRIHALLAPHRFNWL